MRELHAFFETTTAWYEQIRHWPIDSLVSFLKLGDQTRKLLGRLN